MVLDELLDIAVHVVLLFGVLPIRGCRHSPHCLRPNALIAWVFVERFLH